MVAGSSLTPRNRPKTQYGRLGEEDLMTRSARAWTLPAALLGVALILANCGDGDEKTTVIQQGEAISPVAP